MRNWLNIGFVVIIFMTQTSCGNLNETPPTLSDLNTNTPAESTPMNTNIPSPSETPNPTPVHAGIWSEEAPMLTPRSAHAVTSSDSAIYALAGTDDIGKPVLEVEVFNGKEWKLETMLPGQGLNAPTASVVGQRLYVMGGFTAVSNMPTNEVQVYDLQSHEWSMAAPMPNPRGGHVAVVLDGRVHLFGGGNSVSTIDDHSEYDPETDTWRDLSPLPRAEGSPAAVAVEGKIYVIGGRSGYSDFGDVYIYDSATDIWAMGPPIEPRGTAGAAVYCGGIYLFGGESQAQMKNLDDVFRLDLKRNVWESVNPMPNARKFVRAVVFMNSIYIVGGSTVLATSHSPIGSASVERFVQPGCP